MQMGLRIPTAESQQTATDYSFAHYVVFSPVVSGSEHVLKQTIAFGYVTTASLRSSGWREREAYSPFRLHIVLVEARLEVLLSGATARALRYGFQFATSVLKPRRLGMVFAMILHAYHSTSEEDHEDELEPPTTYNDMGSVEGPTAALEEEREVESGGAAPAPSTMAKTCQVTRHSLAGIRAYQRLNHVRPQSTSDVHLGAAKMPTVQYEGPFVARDTK
ncbi:hypothetical protein CSUB01_04836 [Colletotrichum sublineola]|uniref:Uncharacterized protein n=1 Tax=Colletotrichum sublineola TaxID=1173701 RepID=A0A066XSL9_COLSU|nr:hypothetical protein CSUB01_04836 [Colletotrichum sublineola]